MASLSHSDPGASRVSGAELRFQSITKMYGDAAAVDDLDLIIQPGEFVTLLGASGSGKTTTLMMLAGFTQPTSGQIFIGDQDVTHVPPAKRDLGVVFQNYSLFPHLTVAQNLAFPLEMRSMTKHDISSKVNVALEMVQLQDKGRRYPNELSGGQQQRIALARALIFEPQALLMDEPLGALDKNLREHMQLEIKRLHSSLGATVVFVTHDQEEALTMSDRVAVMQDGRIAQISSPQDIYERPANRWVADFIGQSNYLPGCIESSTRSGYIVVLNSGERVYGQGSTSFSNGDTVQVLLRPEQIKISTDQTGINKHTGLNATICDVLYLGHTVKLSLKLADGTQLLAQSQNTGGNDDLRTGKRITVSWNTESLWLIADELVNL